MDNKKNVNSQLFTIFKNVSALENFGKIINYRKNEIIYHAFDDVNYCYYIKKGKVLAYEYALNGQEKIYGYTDTNCLFLEPNLLLDIPCPANFRAYEGNVTLIAIDRVSLNALIDSDPSLAKNMLYNMSYKFLIAMEQHRNQNNHSAEWKICNLLIDFANNCGVEYDGKILLRDKVSQQTISSLLGINRITAVRTIKSLKDMGLIEVVNGYYCIRNMERMERHQNWLLTCMKNI